MRVLGRTLATLAGLPLLTAGVAGLLWAYLPDAPLADTVRNAFAQGIGVLPALGSAEDFEAAVAGPILRFVLAPAGLLLLAFAVLARGGKRDEQIDSELDEVDPLAEGQVVSVEKRLVKKTEKQAAALAKKGQLVDAAEMLFASGSLDQCANYFIQAEEFVRAAEIRHDQGRFVESAELYLQAGSYGSAGSIFSQQGDYVRAADCYLKDESKSLAAEMFEKAEDFRSAADCYRDVEFLRHAAQAYVKCKAWAEAAECLEELCVEERQKGSTDPRKIGELRKLVRQAGKLHARSGNLERALTTLEKGACLLEAAQVALKLDLHARAAELFKAAGEPQLAAQALRDLGEPQEAARVLGEHHRDRGEYEEAAQYFESACEWMAAGDLYRQTEKFEEAGVCYTKQREHAQAAEMFDAIGDRQRAGESWERAGHYEQAAECYALLGLGEREADLLEKAGQFLSAGETYHREGIDDLAIKVLQKVSPDSKGFGRASALLGDLFESRGQLSLAIKKLKHAIGESELDRESVPIFYTLATVYAANDDVAEAVELFEKILAFDYHYKDVEQRLIAARDHLKTIQPVDSVGQVSAQGSFGGSGRPGRYQIVGELGRGGMGIVYKAKDTVLDRIVAYKVLPDALKENPLALKNFLREAKAAAKLNHPNIVITYDTGEQDGRYYIAMEYVDGTTLKEILRRRGVIAPSGILHVLVQVCDALAYAHEHKVVHRDIKTANTMWTRNKKAKIMDFGLAKVVEEVRNHTTVVSGTPYYMSPEQTLGKNIDHRTDIYSLGVSVFEMATGTVPFREGNIPYHHVHTQPPDIRDLRPDLPEHLAAIVSQCLQKDPANRYQSTREILADVRDSLAQTLTRTEAGA